MNHFLNDPYLDSMNFLNEACIKYPEAISFGSGRPVEEFFHLEDTVNGVKRYAEIRGIAPDFLGQYNMTKGIINDFIAKLVKNDENIDISPEDIVLTDGAQEGMAILIDTLFDKNDVLLVTDPSYVGQGVVMTYPLIGNYGVIPEDSESDNVWIKALFIHELAEFESNL